MGFENLEIVSVDLIEFSVSFSQWIVVRLNNNAKWRIINPLVLICTSVNINTTKERMSVRVMVVLLVVGWWLIDSLKIFLHLNSRKSNRFELRARNFSLRGRKQKARWKEIWGDARRKIKNVGATLDAEIMSYDFFFFGQSYIEIIDLLHLAIDGLFITSVLLIKEKIQTYHLHSVYCKFQSH